MIGLCDKPSKDRLFCFECGVFFKVIVTLYLSYVAKGGPEKKTRSQEWQYAIRSLPAKEPLANLFDYSNTVIHLFFNVRAKGDLFYRI